MSCPFLYHVWTTPILIKNHIEVSATTLLQLLSKQAITFQSARNHLLNRQRFLQRSLRKWPLLLWIWRILMMLQIRKMKSLQVSLDTQWTLLTALCNKEVHSLLLYLFVNFVQLTIIDGQGSLSAWHYHNSDTDLVSNSCFLCRAWTLAWVLWVLEIGRASCRERV